MIFRGAWYNARSQKLLEAQKATAVSGSCLCKHCCKKRKDVIAYTHTLTVPQYLLGQTWCPAHAQKKLCVYVYVFSLQSSYILSPLFLLAASLRAPMGAA